MPLAEAEALARELRVAVYDAPADRRALVKLAEACERFSPRVAVEEGDEPESLLLDITNLEHLHGSEAKLVEQVEKFFKRRRYHVRLAAAETVGASWAAAHFEECPNDECRMTNEGAKHSSFVIRHSSLPIESLRISDNITVLLRELGIETVDQLLALPRNELASRFGDELLRRLDQVTGRGRELIEPHRGLPALEVSCTLEEPTGDRGVLMHVLEQLVGQLSRQLAARDQGAVVLMCLLHLVGGRTRADRQPPALPGVFGATIPASGITLCEPPAEPAAAGVNGGVPPGCVSLRVGLLQPSASARQLLELVELHLENVRLADEVDRVELRAVVTGRLGERQRELFADRWPTDLHQVAVLVNRLSSRLGAERVLRAELRKSPMPERAVEWKPAVERKEGERGRGGERERKKNRKSGSLNLPLSQSPPLPPRPLTLHPKPEATEVVSVAPDGPPQFVWMGRHRERIVGCIGPERIETLWWRGPSVRRDYYRVATESGEHLWMFRQLADGKWFVHGEFS